MMTLYYVWAAVGFGFGVCFATLCLTIATLIDDYFNEKERNNGKQQSQREKRRTGSR